MPSASRRFRAFAWPDRRTCRNFAWYAAWLSLEWILVYGGANWVVSMHTYRIHFETGVERYIPFVPQASFVYLSLFPMLWLAPFRLHQPTRLRRFAAALGCLIAISGIGFLILPTESGRSLPPVAGISGAAFQFADWINLTYNYLPSLHVGMAVVCAYAYSRPASAMAAMTYWLWAAAIAISTLLTHQHYLVDVFVGGTLGYLIAAQFHSVPPKKTAGGRDCPRPPAFTSPT